VAALMWWLSGIAAIRVLARRLGAPVESLKPLGTGLHVAVVLSAVGTLVSHFAAVDLATLLAGAFTLTAIGFVALWSTLSNILCTVLILMTRPFRIGDELTFPPDDIEGRVVDLSFFFTTLRTNDGRFINVPNTMFFQRILVRRESSVAVELGEQLARKEVVDLEAPPPPSPSALK
ncbi:MAG: mechanosensitive ion channel, partial [Archangium sp.]|nr:mechanosensitive ion channel [Archangium sp.]